MRLPLRSRTNPPASRLGNIDLDALTCEWDRDLLSVGLQPGLPAHVRVGLSLLAFCSLAAALLAASLTGKSGTRPEVFGVVLVLVAAVPWLRWAMRDDNGPSWSFAAFVVAPMAALGLGRWQAIPTSLESDPAYYLATFPVPWLVLLYTAFAPMRMAIGVAIAAVAGFVVPLLGGWALGQLTGDLAAPLIWVTCFAFCITAGYAVRLSYITNRRIGAAREALARQAAAEERRRIAQDVHDVVAHTLAITMLHITAARMAVRRSSPEDAEEALEEAERHGRASLNDIRSIVRLLRSDSASAVDAAQPGLSDVEALTESYRAAGLPVRLSLAIDGSPASPTAELALYRVLQEALANAARHGSGPATVDLHVTDGAMSLSVDNPLHQQTAQPSQGSGLIGMRERIAAAGGTIEAGVRNGRWIVRAVVPGGASA